MWDRISRFMLDHVLAPIQALWAHIRTLWGVIEPSRFSAFMVVVGYILLFATEQGKELAIGLGDALPPQIVLFIVAVSWWAVQSWVWARVTLNQRFGHDRARYEAGLQKWLIENLPRLYGLFVFALAILALLRSPAGENPASAAQVHAIGLVIAVIAVAFYILLRVRLPLQDRLFAWLRRRLPQRAEYFRSAMQPRPTRWFQLSLAPSTQWLFRIAVAVAVVMTVIAVGAPVATGNVFGSAGIAFMAFATIIPIGSFLVVVSLQARVPVITLSIVVFLATSTFVDNHRVRVCEEIGICRDAFEERNAAEDAPAKAEPGTSPGIAAYACPTSPGATAVDAAICQRRTVPDAVAAWLAANQRSSASAQQPIPVVFVSTAGGGLRAAYWTATVLGYLQDRHPCFANRVFSVSGVSGGSVGAAVWAGLLADANAGVLAERCETHDGKAQSPASAASYRRRGQAVLAGDFLAPTLAALLYGDILYRFLPLGEIPGLRFLRIPDRGAALEESWEVSWREACAATDCRAGNLLAGPFLGLWRTDPPPAAAWWRPALLLNGTHQETGKRIVQSNIVVGGRSFDDVYDFYALSNRDTPVSTAAQNSARFTYVSPAGGLVRVLGAAGETRRSGHVLDGGYFENFGAVTSLELARAALPLLARDGPSIRPIFIQISSNPMLRADALDRAESDAGAAATPMNCCDRTGRFANQLVAPIDGLLNTRNARGILAAKELSRFAEINGATFVHLRLCPTRDPRNAALGWVLSSQSQRDIDAQLAPDDRFKRGCGNADALNAVLDALAGAD